jgi:hypothetical protein
MYTSSCLLQLTAVRTIGSDRMKCAATLLAYCRCVVCNALQGFTRDITLLCSPPAHARPHLSLQLPRCIMCTCTCTYSCSACCVCLLLQPLQGFTREITLPRDRWVGFFKDYDGGSSKASSLYMPCR